MPTLLTYIAQHSKDADALNELANRMEKENHWGEALQDYQKAAQLRPSLESAWLGALRCAQRINDFQTLITIANQLKQTPYRTAKIWYELGRVYFQIGAIPQALNAYKSATKLDAQHTPSLDGLAKVYLHLGDAQHALDAAQKALRLCPHNISYLLDLATALQQTGQLERAKKVLLETLHLAPTNIEVMARWGQFLASTATSPSQQEQAAQQLQKAAQGLKDPTLLYSVNYSLGQTYLLLNRLKDAEQAFRRALQIKPDDTQTLFALGRTLSFEGRRGDAQKVLSQFHTESQYQLTLSQIQMRVARQPQSALLWTRLAWIYAKQQQWLLAIQAAQQSLQLNPQQSALQRALNLWAKKVFRGSNTTMGSHEER